MNFKKTKVAVASGLMAASMVLAPMAAYARTGAPTDWNENTKPELSVAEIVKTINAMEGVTIADDVTFHLEQIHNKEADAPNETKTDEGSTFAEISNIVLTEDGKESTNSNAGYKTASYVEASDKEGAHYVLKNATAGKTQASDNKKGAEADNKYETCLGIDFANATVKKDNQDVKLENGLYTFKVTEVKTEGMTLTTDKVTRKEGESEEDYKKRQLNDGYGWTLNSDTAKEGSAEGEKEYTLKVYVSTENGERTVKYTVVDSQGKKKNGADFENNYTRRANEGTPTDPDDPGKKNEDGVDVSLAVDKTVSNPAFADASYEYEFEIEFLTNNSKLAPVPSSADGFGAKVVKKTTKDGTTISVKEENVLTAVNGKTNTYSFKLKAGETVEFANIPAGVYYNLEELAFTNDGGTTWTAYENGKTASSEAERAADHKDVALKLGEKKNSVSFVNTIRNISYTGVVTHSAPFVVMIGALFAAVGGYVVLKKKVEE